jgi:uncharacterized protein (TIGR02588 family)
MSESQTNESQKSSGGEEKEQPVTLLEKIATGLSALLVALIVAVLIWDAVHPDTPARLTIDVSPPSIVGSQYQVPVTVHNRGDKSAKDVAVHFELIAATTDSVLAESDLTIDWLPRESSRDVVGLFARPSIGSAVGARADVRGYVVP